MRYFPPIFETRYVPTGSSWWRHIRCGLRLCRHGGPCRLCWFSVKQWSNYSTLCPVGPVLRTFVQYWITFCSRPQAASDIVSGTFVSLVVLVKRVKFHDPCLNRSWEIPREAARGGIFDCFPPITFWSEVDNDVISGTAVDNVGMGVPVKFGDSGSNGFRDSRSWFRVKRTNEHGSQ